jgi:heme exporter protein A
MIVVKRLIKLFGSKKVLRGLDFHAEEGEFIALLGPNGAGKSTFLRILATLSRPTFGEVRVAGYRLPEQASYVRAHLGVVTHQPLLYSDLTAEENLRFYARMYGIENSRARIIAVFELIGLASRQHDLVRTFSRGMQQRLSIGRAVLHNPDVMLFDEPYTGLDQDACNMLDTVLKEIAAGGRTVVITSHDLSRVENLASRFDILSHGVISDSASREDLTTVKLFEFYTKALI